MNKLPWRFKWSRDLVVHRQLIKVFNRSMRHVPFGIKYGIGKRLRAGSFPYCLIKPGAVVVQVGAPSDTLLAGRSRAMYFSLFSGPQGQVVVVEPDANSLQIFETLARKRTIENLIFCPMAAWSREQILTVFVNDAHPASSFTDGSKSYDAKRMATYRAVELPAARLDTILASAGISQVDLVSITTNGAEREIMSGMTELIASGLPYISLAVTGENYEAMMADYGYRLYGYDDRGFTFQQIPRLESNDE